MPKQNSKGTSQKIADRLKQLRKEKEITQSELANDIEVSRATVVGYESGSVMPSTDTLIKIANIYKVSMDWLCGLNDNMNGGKLVTFADVINQIVELSDLLGADLESNYYELPDDMGQNIEVFIKFSNYTIGNFVTEYNEIKNLSVGGNMKQELINLWLKNKIKELENVNYKKWDGANGHSVSWDVPHDDNDDDLPF